jgi:hypothetical protein
MELRELTGEAITDSRKLASTIANIVRETDRWAQSSWFSSTWFGNVPMLAEAFSPAPTFSVETARKDLKANACGSTCCIAGWAAILSAPAGTRVDYSDNVIAPDGARAYADYYARSALGLDANKAGYLFNGNRTREEVLDVLDAMAAGEDWDVPEEPEDDDRPWDAFDDDDVAW